MELMAAIEQRRAVREFESQHVPLADLHKLIDSAVWAPSAMNHQPWHFAAVTDPALLQTISVNSKAWLLQSDQLGLANEQLHAMLKDPAFHILHHAPALVVIGAPRDEKWGVEDCAMAAQNLMLRATELGLGTCWIGLAQGWLNTPEGLNLLKFPTWVKVVAPIIVGMPRRRLNKVARNQPNIIWIGSKPAEFIEGDGTSGRSPEHNLYGKLIHP